MWYNMEVKEVRKMPEKPERYMGKSMDDTENETGYPVITKITTQRRKGRYNIFLNEKYAFAVDEALLVKYLLRKGMEISPERQNELQEEDESRKAYQRALVYLQYGLRSEKEVRDDLIAHEFEGNTDDVIDLLKDQLLINDAEYAKSFVRTGANMSRKGPKVIDRELIGKGILEKDRLNAMEEYPFEQQVENAVTLGEKVIVRSSRRSSRETHQKIREHLMIKGYPHEVIEETLPMLSPEKEEDEEMAALELHGEKAWRRNSKFDGYQRIQKTKASLFQKGFPMELINIFIENKESEEEK